MSEQGLASRWQLAADSAEEHRNISAAVAIRDCLIELTKVKEELKARLRYKETEDDGLIDIERVLAAIEEKLG